MKALPMTLQLFMPYLFLGTFYLFGNFLPTHYGLPSIYDGASSITVVGIFLLIGIGIMVYAFLLPSMGYSGRKLLFWNLVLKLVAIPIYVSIFITCALFIIFVIPAIPFLVAFDYFLLLVTSMYGVNGIIQSAKEGNLSTAEAALMGIGQFFFCFDVFSALYCYIKVRCRSKDNRSPGMMSSSDSVSDVKIAFLVEVHMEERTFFLLWTEGESSADDAFLTDDNGPIASFPSKGAAYQYAHSKGYACEDEGAVIECDATVIGVDGSVDCATALDQWNMFADAAHALGISFMGDALNGPVNDVYNKIFAGNNLPAVRGDDTLYAPIWDEEEITVIKAVLESGRKLFASGLGSYDVK